MQIDRAAFDDGELDQFSPGTRRYWGYLIGERTDRWSDSNVHCCSLHTAGHFYRHDWTSDQPGKRIVGYQDEVLIGLLLDLVEGTLSVYQSGQRLETLIDGLSGEYCWYATVYYQATISIERGSAPGERG